MLRQGSHMSSSQSDKISKPPTWEKVDRWGRGHHQTRTPMFPVSERDVRANLIYSPPGSQRSCPETPFSGIIQSICNLRSASNASVPSHKPYLRKALVQTPKRNGERQRVALLLFCALLGLSSPSPAQSPAGWKTFQGTYFSFSYPPTWTLKQNGDGDVLVQPPASDSLFYEIGYVTSYQGDTIRLLADQQTQLKQWASDNRVTISFAGPEPSLLGGSAITAYIKNSVGDTLTYWIDAVVIGKAIYVLDMLSPGPDYFSNLGAYRDPITASVRFGSGGVNGASSALLGPWDPCWRQRV